MTTSDFSEGPFGFNVIGYVSGNVGLGVAARSIVSLLLEKGIPVAVYDVEAGLGRSKHDIRFENLTVNSATNLPYSVNLFVCDPVSLSAFMTEEQVPILDPNYLNVGVIFWELPLLSEISKAALKLLDVIVSMTDFIRYVVEFNVSNVFTVSAFHPLNLPTPIEASRTDFHLPADEVLFITSFEPYSDARRKNALAVIEAFERATVSDGRGHLILKLNNAVVNGQYHPSVAEIMVRRKGHPRIRVMTETLFYPEVLKLYASCDVFVSLHRAEGLGLGLMEAMSLGKPVIATAWSGNLSFMTHANSCLVGCNLIPVEASVHDYTKEGLGVEALWADPNVEEAAVWIKKLISDPSLRARIGKRAAEDMAKYQDRAREAEFIDELVAIKEQRSVTANHAAEKTRQLELLRQQIALENWRLSRSKMTLTQRAYVDVKRLLDRHLLWRINRPRENAAAGA